MKYNLLSSVEQYQQPLMQPSFSLFKSLASLRARQQQSFSLVEPSFHLHSVPLYSSMSQRKSVSYQQCIPQESLSRWKQPLPSQAQVIKQCSSSLQFEAEVSDVGDDPFTSMQEDGSIQIQYKGIKNKASLYYGQGFKGIVHRIERIFGKKIGMKGMEKIKDQLEKRKEEIIEKKRNYDFESALAVIQLSVEKSRITEEKEENKIKVERRISKNGENNCGIGKEKPKDKDKVRIPLKSLYGVNVGNKVKRAA